MFKKVAFTMYPITDVARARRFYEETLGLKRGSMGNRGDQYWIEYYLPAGGCLALTNFISDTPSDKAGGTVALEVDGLDKLMRDLEGKGVTFESEVIDTPVCRTAVCLDSEGNSLLCRSSTAYTQRSHTAWFDCDCRDRHCTTIDESPDASRVV